ncbi:hypothetical protein BM1_09075 [Bipolaris maydis]|nr:hypothetical protein BM1_09075 [Bipolaris maydis]
MAGRPNLQDLSQASNEALEKLKKFRTENPLLIATIPPSPDKQHLPTGNLPGMASQPSNPHPRPPRVYHGPLVRITRDMVFDRIYLLLTENLPTRWTQNPEALAHLSKSMANVVIRSGQYGDFGPYGLSSLAQISAYIGHEGIYHYMCLAHIHLHFTGTCRLQQRRIQCYGNEVTALYNKAPENLEPILTLKAQVLLTTSDSQAPIYLWSQVKLGTETPPLSPTVAKEVTLRSHLQELLDKLPQDLPVYHHEELLDGICFLLHSPLFSYVVSPRIRREEQKAKSYETNAVTTQTPLVKKAHKGVIRESATYLALSKLRIDINQEKNDWITRLLYNNAILIEGRDLGKARNSSFVTSFHFFCEEVAFLSSEFRSRERAGAVLRGAAGEQQLLEMDLDSTRVASAERKKRRLVKLKESQQMDNLATLQLEV